MKIIFALIKGLQEKDRLLFGSIAPSKVMAETGVGKDVFKIVVSLYGITDSVTHEK